MHMWLLQELCSNIFPNVELSKTRIAQQILLKFYFKKFINEILKISLRKDLR